MYPKNVSTSQSLRLRSQSSPSFHPPIISAPPMLGAEYIKPSSPLLNTKPNFNLVPDRPIIEIHQVMESYFHQVPTFPRDVPTIDLRCLSYTKLIAGDISESGQLFQSCKENGFFLLDLRGSDEGDRMLEHADFAFKLNEELMRTDKEELEKYAYKPPGSLFGYKGVGKIKNEDGSPDNVEFYNMSQDDMIGNVAPSSHPPLISQNRHQIRSFYTHAHTILMHLMSHIDTHLGLDPGTLASLNPLDQPSGTSLRFLKAPALPPGSAPRAGLYGHTDLGSMTMLFNIVGGLQVLVPPNAEHIESNYKYVKPQPGCAIINLGDAIVPWSGELLRSNMHRVAMAPGEQKTVDRYSVAYLMRPAANVSMRRLAKVEMQTPVTTKEEEGEKDICAKDWEKMRVARVIEGNLKQIGVAQVKEVAA